MVEPVAQPAVRVATAADAPRLAALHTRSWRSAYRGSFSDAYLDGPIEAERDAFWHDRYALHTPGLWTVMAENPKGELLGFLCLLEDHDPTFGTLIDNLHVDPDRKAAGIGRLMMRAAGQHLQGRCPTRPIYLFVLDANRAAQAFYDRIGGEAVERLIKTEPDGTPLPVIRYAWRDAAAFIERVG